MGTEYMTPSAKIAPLIIAGSGRSGTTWVLDVIADANNLQTIFEPLHHVVGKTAIKYAGKYVSPTSKDDELRKFMDAVLGADLRSIWTDYRTLPDRLVPELKTFISPRKAIEIYGHYKNLWKNYKKSRSFKNTYGVAVKFIRANLMLNWLIANYNVNVLFVVRHPCAVIESKIRLDAAAKQAGLSHGTSDWDPYPLLKRYLDDPVFQKDFVQDYLDKFKKDSYTEVEAHALIWCFENVPVIMNAHKNNICVSCYENLVINGKEEWSRIVAFLKLKNTPEDAGLKSPSQQASEDFRQYASDKERLSRWSERLGEESLLEISNILKAFNVELYNPYNVMPCGNVTESNKKDS